MIYIYILYLLTLELGRIGGHENTVELGSIGEPLALARLVERFRLSEIKLKEDEKEKKDDINMQASTRKAKESGEKKRERQHKEEVKK